MNIEKPVGGRRAPRPEIVRTCLSCRQPLGAGYAECPNCHAAIESIWLADWYALLQQEQVVPGSADERLLAQVVLLEFGCHPWTVLDIAMSKLRCSQCNAELGEAYSDCPECGMAFGSSILAEFNATGNEHALHIGRWVLRYPHRHSQNAVTAWRMSIPRLLTGWLPSIKAAQQSMVLIKAGRAQELEQMCKELDLAIQQIR
jgi:uncharacterized protein (UPF0212 family)